MKTNQLTGRVQQFIESQEIALGLNLQEAELLGSILMDAIKGNYGERRNSIRALFEKLDTAPALTAGQHIDMLDEVLEQTQKEIQATRNALKA